MKSRPCLAQKNVWAVPSESAEKVRSRPGHEIMMIKSGMARACRKKSKARPESCERKLPWLAGRVRVLSQNQDRAELYVHLIRLNRWLLKSACDQICSTNQIFQPYMPTLIYRGSLTRIAIAITIFATISDFNFNFQFVFAVV